MRVVGVILGRFNRAFSLVPQGRLLVKSAEEGIGMCERVASSKWAL